MRDGRVADDPAIAVGLSATAAAFNGEVTAFDKAANDFLNASFSHATFGGKPRDAWPGVAFSVIDEIGEDIGEHEAERRQGGISTHLVEPDEFVARKRCAVTACLVDVAGAVNPIVGRSMGIEGQRRR